MEEAGRAVERAVAAFWRKAKINTPDLRTAYETDRKR